MGNPQEVRDEFEAMMVDAELATPGQLPQHKKVGKFAANARRLRLGEITPQEFERIMRKDEEG
ncbi:hypothetical protein SAMN04489832_3416 [Micromonospora cremea]|uniref:Antitoxin VbhA domain-containing protein n=2 Tax=Micromonospora cremea TaxID=709881 RepID=A0A1N5YY18_9ACTN|nr:hypothetical protein SAMN04489832_3416 [Micromonospora cremea]